MNKFYIIAIVLFVCCWVGCNGEANLANRNIPSKKGPERDKKLLEMIQSLNNELNSRISKIDSYTDKEGKEKYEKIVQITR